MERFGLSDAQSQAIVDMRLRALTGLERDKLENEYKELEVRIAELKAILADEKKLLGVIKEEIQVISDKYGDDRRTSIGFDEFDMSAEDLIPNDETIVAHDQAWLHQENVQGQFQEPEPRRQRNQGYADHR